VFEAMVAIAQRTQVVTVGASASASTGAEAGPVGLGVVELAELGRPVAGWKGADPVAGERGPGGLGDRVGMPVGDVASR
jgi:hypothetical protein